MEPTAALVAVLAVCAGVSLYATVLEGAFPTPDRDRAGPTLSALHDSVERSGVVRPDALADAHSTAPDGYRMNVSLAADGRRWTAGPSPPPRADDARRRVSVAGGPGRVRPGWLRVAVWR